MPRTDRAVLVADPSYDHLGARLVGDLVGRQNPRVRR